MAGLTLAAIAMAGSALAEPLAETSQATPCPEDGCSYQMTAPEVLALAERLVAQGRYREAAPLIAALEHTPEFAMQRRFLAGFSAVETGDAKSAESNFRAALAINPNQTRVRLELARALMMQGKTASADHHFKVAQGDQALPDEIAASVKAYRGLLRDMRPWRLNVSAGFAPDSNITNGTNAESIDIAFGNQLVPLRLGEGARAKSGLGQTMGLSGAARLALSGETKFLIEGDAIATNYKGKRFDDLSGQLAIGPEFRLGGEGALSVQALGAWRWYGGKRANLSGGLRASYQRGLDSDKRLTIALDARRTDSGFDRVYDGWQIGGTASFEQAVSPTMIASASLFARRDLLNGKSYSGTEFGANLGIGGELPLGITAGISGGISRSLYDAPIPLFAGKPRNDLRLNGRVHLGLRSVRLLGFSPSVTYSYGENSSSLALYDSRRHRISFGFAKYF